MNNTPHQPRRSTDSTAIPRRSVSGADNASPDVVRTQGLSPETAPGLQLASSLKSDRPLHRALAIVALVVILAGVVSMLVSFITSLT